MAAEPASSHPAVQYLKDHALLVGSILAVVIAVAVWAFTQAAPKTEAAAVARPTVSATATLGGDETASASATPTAAPEDSAAALAAAAAQAAAQASPEAAGPVVLGAAPQAPSEKPWRPYADAFGTAWVNLDGGKDAWLARLKPLVSEGLYDGFTSTDINAIPIDTYESVTIIEESPMSKTLRGYLVNNGHFYNARLTIQHDGTWLVDQLTSPDKKY